MAEAAFVAVAVVTGAALRRTEMGRPAGLDSSAARPNRAAGDDKPRTPLVIGERRLGGSGKPTTSSAAGWAWNLATEARKARWMEAGMTGMRRRNTAYKIASPSTNKNAPASSLSALAVLAAEDCTRTMQLPLLLAVLAVVGVGARRVVPIKIQKEQPVGARGIPLLHRRQNGKPFDEDLTNNLTSGAYFAQVEIGTPGQTLSLHVDTGSTDVWVLGTSTNLCTNTLLQATYGGCLDAFDRSASSTFERVGSGNDFEIRYMDGSGASGFYFTDDINVGGLNVSDVQMGYAQRSTSAWGMLGIGYAKNSAARVEYPSLLDQMHDQSLIGTKAYSLYLNDVESSTGTILFGGIDTEKFYGTLKSIPILPDPQTGHITHFNVSLSGLAVLSGNPKIDSSTLIAPASPVPVILDSGTTLTYLPGAVTAPLFAKLNAYDRSGAEIPVVYVDCTIVDTDPSLVLSYQFNGPDGPVVQVSIADIVFDDIKQYVAAGLITLPSKLPFPKENVCSLGVMTSAAGDVHLLGDTFLRSAYAVYDLSNDVIALAQSHMNSTRENIVEIPANATGIPPLEGQVAPEVVRPAKENGGHKVTMSVIGLALGLVALVL
ncbi:hypothetical protein OQA88_8693 [Cercophora sp. LCS_1]